MQSSTGDEDMQSSTVGSRFGSRFTLSGELAYLLRCRRPRPFPGPFPPPSLRFFGMEHRLFLPQSANRPARSSHTALPGSLLRTPCRSHHRYAWGHTRWLWAPADASSANRCTLRSSTRWWRRSYPAHRWHCSYLCSSATQGVRIHPRPASKDPLNTEAAFTYSQSSTTAANMESLETKDLQDNGVLPIASPTASLFKQNRHQSASDFLEATYSAVAKRLHGDWIRDPAIPIVTRFLGKVKNNGLDVMIVKEIHSGVDTCGTELEGIDRGILMRALRLLEQKGKAAIFKRHFSRRRGCKIFYMNIVQLLTQKLGFL